MGALMMSPSVPAGIPSISAATRSAKSCASGIHTGFGAPWPWREVSRRRPVSSRRLVYVVSELSSDCITSPMNVRCDQLRTERLRANTTGCRAARPRNRAQRGTRPPPGMAMVVSSPIAFEPLP